MTVPLALLLLAGCGHGMYRGMGEVSSSGGKLGHWSAAPMGCSRDLFLGTAEGRRSRSVATFVWIHRQDLSYAEFTALWASNTPLRLEIASTGGGYQASLSTFREAGILIDSAACTTFRLEEREKPAYEAAGRPVLDGRLIMDCPREGGRLEADIQFVNCGY